MMSTTNLSGSFKAKKSRSFGERYNYKGYDRTPNLDRRMRYDRTYITRQHYNNYNLQTNEHTRMRRNDRHERTPPSAARAQSPGDARKFSHPYCSIRAATLISSRHLILSFDIQIRPTPLYDQFSKNRRSYCSRPASPVTIFAIFCLGFGDGRRGRAGPVGCGSDSDHQMTIKWTRGCSGASRLGSFQYVDEKIFARRLGIRARAALGGRGSRLVAFVCVVSSHVRVCLFRWFITWVEI